jgi:hypothetical protein
MIDYEQENDWSAPQTLKKSTLKRLWLKMGFLDNFIGFIYLKLNKSSDFTQICLSLFENVSE